MKKNIFKIITIFIIIMIFFGTIGVFANENPIDKLNASIGSPGDGAMKEMNSLRDKIFTIIMGAGTGISVIAILILSIKYFISAPNERAELKKYIITFVIAAVVFFGAQGVVDLLRNFGTDIFSASEQSASEPSEHEE